jgi:tyrosyl-tRNA synthetase
MATSDLDRLLRGAAEVIPREELERKLALDRPLRVKLGIDPSRPDLHLGHAVVLRKLRQFQDLGHIAVLIIGDFTGRVGDPSGQSETRPFLTEEEIDANAQTYLDQAGLVLDVDKAEIRRNSEWLATLSMAQVLQLASQATVARMLERDDFQSRYREGQPISVVEFLYPLMQSTDSVEVAADVEMGGTDQTFNLLMGRDIQRAHGQEPQVVFTMPLLEGTDGKRKMSKSFDNYVSLTDPPEEMFGKLMSIPDSLLDRYEELAAFAAPEELQAVDLKSAEGLPEAAARKRRMAKWVVSLYHGWTEAHAAEQRFDLVHKRGEIPADVPEAEIPPGALRDGRVSLPHLVALLGMADSNSEARRVIGQRGVKIDGKVVDDPEAELPVREVAGRIIQVGKRQFRRLRAS